jgi:AraC-like DNA-binding protein
VTDLDFTLQGPYKLSRFAPLATTMSSRPHGTSISVAVQNFYPPQFKVILEQAKRPYRLKLVDVRIQILTRLIQSELHRDLCLEELAHSVNLSSSRLRHLFKHDTGQTLAQYVMCQRMNRARLLLGTTHLSVKEVMNQVGIGDPSHFARDFKKRFGISPTSCRQHKALDLNLQ